MTQRSLTISIPGITLRGVKVPKASADVPVYLNIDGEADGMFPAEFEVLPRAVTVLAPRRHAERGKV